MKLKAKTTEVKIGLESIPGYMLLHNGRFAVNQSDLLMLADPTCERNQAAKRYIEISQSKMAQTLFPQGFKPHRNVEILDQAYVSSANLIEINEIIPFLTVCIALDSKKYYSAVQWLALLGGLSIQQLFCDAFGIKFDLEERQAWLKSRMEGMVERSALTDAIKAYQEEKGTYGTDPLEFAICSDIVNREILGMVAKAARVHYAVPDKELLRDYLPDDRLKQIKFIENLAAKLIAKGHLPAAATKQAIALLN